MSEVNQKADTPAEQALQRAFSALYLHFESNLPFVISTEEHKSYTPDFVLTGKRSLRSTIVECEGKGSSSKDNAARDAYFNQRGMKVLHIPNKMALKYPYEIAVIIEALL